MTIMEHSLALGDNKSPVEAVPPIPHPLDANQADVLLEAALAAGEALQTAESNGVSLPYDIEIKDWEPKSNKYVRGVGRIQTDIVSLWDGSRFVFRKIEPVKQRSGISADFMPPLATRANGFNEFMGRRLAKAGLHNRLVGTNQARGFTLLHDVQAFLEILNTDDYTQTSSSGESIQLGYSMGAMKGLGALGLAPRMERTHHTGILIDPCIAERLDYTEERPLEAAAYIGREILELGKIVKQGAQDETLLKSLARGRHLLKTFSFSPTFLGNAHDKWQVIKTGETGTFPALMDPDTLAVIHFFMQSRYNQKPSYDRLLENHSSVRNIEEDGYHMSGGNPAFVGKVVGKAALAIDLIDSGVHGTELLDAISYPLAA